MTEHRQPFAADAPDDSGEPVISGSAEVPTAAAAAAAVDVLAGGSPVTSGLTTCGGSFLPEPGSYHSDDVVVVAVPLG